MNTHLPQPADRPGTWGASALAMLGIGAMLLVTVGCAVSAAPRGPGSLYLSVVVAMVVMSVRGMSRAVADLLGEATHLLASLVRLAVLIVFVAAAVVIAGVVLAASLVAAAG